MGKKFLRIVTDITIIAVSFLIPGAGPIFAALRVAVALKGLSRLASDITGKPRVNPTPINITVRGTIEARRIVFGTRRAGGVMVFYGVSGTNNKYLWYVIAYAGHQSSAFSDFWIDERRIASSDVPSGSGGTVTASPWNSKLTIWKHLGTSSQTVDTNMSSAFGAWDSSHKLLGTTYAVIRFERDDNVYPDGAPQAVTALVDGLLLYDPRKDSTNGGSGSHRTSDPSTWEFSRDPVQMIRWYMTGGSVHNDVSSRLVMYGLRELDSRMDDAYTIAASNHCDETLSGANAPPSGSQPRYRCDLEVNCAESRRDILTALLASMAGTMVYVKGKWRIHAGVYDSPVHTLTEQDLYGELEVQDTTTHADRYNAVCPIFIDASSQYVQTTGKYRTDSSYETQDGGERIPIPLQLDGVTDQYQAQRLAEIHLRRSRMMRGIKIVGALNLLKVALHETISYSHSRYGWTNRVFRCKERGFEPDQDACRVTLQLQRDDVGVWTDMLTADYSSGTSNTDVYQDDNLRVGYRAEVQTATISSVTIASVSHVPDGFGFNDTLASISYTPAVDCDIVITANFTVSYAVNGSLGYLDFFSSIQDGTYDGFKKQEWFDKPGAGQSRVHTFSITRQFSGTAGVAVTYKVLGCKFDSSDTVTIDNGLMVLTVYR